MAEPLRTLIADDEPLAIERMEALCATLDGIEIVGSARDGRITLLRIGALSPDLVLLDISMPECDGLEVARTLFEARRGSGRMPAIVFVTAHDNFAVEAFDTSAVDYLLKPVSRERLERALERAARHLERQAPATPDVGDHATEFWVPHRSELVRVAAADIERVDAERDYMHLKLAERSYLLHQTITALEQRLDPTLFIRLHRSTIVRRDRIARLGHDGAGAWHAELIDGAQVRIGRTYLAAAKTMVRTI